MALRPGGAKAKGASGERELAAVFVGWAAELGVDLDLTRNLDQTRDGGHDLTGMEEKYKLAIEVKRVEQKALKAWWRQAVRQGDEAGCRPVLAWRQNRQPWRFRVRLWVHPCNHLLDVDMEAEPFKVWFQALVDHHTTM